MVVVLCISLCGRLNHTLDELKDESGDHLDEQRLSFRITAVQPETSNNAYISIAMCFLVGVEDMIKMLPKVPQVAFTGGQSR